MLIDRFFTAPSQKFRTSLNSTREKLLFYHFTKEKEYITTKAHVHKRKKKKKPERLTP